MIWMDNCSCHDTDAIGPIVEEFKSELDAISLNSTLINPINMQYEFLKNKITPTTK